MSHSAGHHPNRSGLGHEVTDANPKVLAYALVGLALLLIFVFVAMWLLFIYFDSRAEKAETGRPSQWGQVDYRPPEPRLQTSPAEDMEKMREREERLIHSYGWVNKASGIVRIPVDRAMDIVAAKGLPKLPPIGMAEDTPNPFSTPSMATTPVATGTDSSRQPAALGGPAGGREPVPPPSRNGETRPTQEPDGGNRNR
ncbi:MAG: hypothetical protein ACE15E_15280 [Acidobacteriota bacterium]